MRFLWGLLEGLNTRVEVVMCKSYTLISSLTSYFLKRTHENF